MEIFKGPKVNIPHDEIQNAINSVRTHKYMSESLIASWRNTGLLDDTQPGSWDETMLACLLENQRLMGRSDNPLDY